MDENNVGNQSQGTMESGGQYSNYQDNTANMSNQVPIENVPDGKANGLQVAGLVCGILAICTCCCGIIGVIFGIAGLICSIIGNKNNKNGVGIAGLVCSIIGLLLGLVILIYSMAMVTDERYWEAYWEILEQIGY